MDDLKQRQNEESRLIARRRVGKYAQLESKVARPGQGPPGGGGYFSQK